VSAALLVEAFELSFVAYPEYEWPLGPGSVVEHFLSDAQHERCDLEEAQVPDCRAREHEGTYSSGNQCAALGWVP